MEDSYNPYNDSNVEIVENDVNRLLETYDTHYKVQDIRLFQRAFVHRSYVQTNAHPHWQRPPNCVPLKHHSNERLEFLGDGVLECVTKMYLYKRFPDADEGFMTEKKICLVKNDHIGKLAHRMGLEKWFIISRNAEEKKIRNNYKKLGCLFEAFLGALFLDANNVSVDDSKRWFQDYFRVGPGFQICQLFIEAIYEKLVDWNEILEKDTNYKNILQVKVQKEFKCTPEYIILNHDDEMRYTMGVFLVLEGANATNPADAVDYDDVGSFEEIHKQGHTFVFFGSGTHKIKKKAEQLACLDALNKIDNVNNNNNNE